MNKFDNLREFDRSFYGLPCRRYRDMKARISGSPHKRSQSKGLYLLPKVEFIDWTIGNTDYIDLYLNWIKKEFVKPFAPSIHRLNNKKGYQIGNMAWITVAEHEEIGR